MHLLRPLLLALVLSALCATGGTAGVQTDEGTAPKAWPAMGPGSPRRSDLPRIRALKRSAPPRRAALAPDEDDADDDETAAIVGKSLRRHEAQVAGLGVFTRRPVRAPASRPLYLLHCALLL